jgi:integrase
MTDTLNYILESLYFPLRAVSITSDQTRYQYELAVRDFGRFLQREPTKADLTDDNLTLWMASMLRDKLAPITVRERAGRLGTLWTWLAKRRLVDQFPTFGKPRAPQKIPQSLTECELIRFFRSCSKERGKIGPVPADIWCLSFFGFVLNTSERKSAALAVEIRWLNLQDRVCVIPAEVRKGGIKPAVYPIWQETVPLLAACIAADPCRLRMWPWHKCHESYYTMLNRILRDAELPVDRAHKTHCLRVTHNTLTKVMTGQHSPLLGHSSPETSHRHYEDVRLTQKPSLPFFVPWLPQEPRS